MTGVKLLGVFAGLFTLLCMTGFDYPECNYAEQAIATGIAAIVCIVCGLIAYRKENK